MNTTYLRHQRELYWAFWMSVSFYIRCSTTIICDEAALDSIRFWLLKINDILYSRDIIICHII